jgi:intein/homing endonuclease
MRHLEFCREAGRAHAMGRALRASTSALHAPPPSDGEVLRTALPDTWDGIRFEIGRMIKYVQDARRDPIMLEHCREICGQWMEAAREQADFESRPFDPKRAFLDAVEAWCRAHYAYVNDPPNIEVIQTPRRMIKWTRIPPKVIAHITEPFREAIEAANPLYSGRRRMPPPLSPGDCIPLSQKIVVRDKSSGRYKTIPVGDVRETWRYYQVVSYNESDGKFEFRSITNFIEKGVLPVYRVKLSNGTEFRCTENHTLYVLEKSPSWQLVTMTLRELIDRKASLGVHETLAIPVSKSIPEAGLKARNCPELSDEQIWIEGLYVAEGWSERVARNNKRSKIGMNNPEAIAELKEKLEAIGQPYGAGERQDGLVTVRMYASAFTNRLGNEFGLNSAEKRFPDWYTSLDREQLDILLSAYAIGDGYRPTSGQWARWANLVYNTKSEALAKQIAFMHLVLGRPISFYKQPAWKTKPVMYRLYEYKGTAEEKAPGIVSTRIVSIERDEAEACCDITVAENHNFILDGGVLVHNCDEGSTLMLGHCVCIPICMGEEIGPFRFRFGGNDGTLHHVWAYIHAGGTWYDCDLTEPSYRLGDHSGFEAYEDVEVPIS